MLPHQPAREFVQEVAAARCVHCGAGIISPVERATRLDSPKSIPTVDTGRSTACVSTSIWKQMNHRPLDRDRTAAPTFALGQRAMPLHLDLAGDARDPEELSLADCQPIADPELGAPELGAVEPALSL